MYKMVNPYLAVFLLTLPSGFCDTGGGIVSVNFQPARWMNNGKIFYVHNERPTVFRVCAFGDIRRQCLGITDDSYRMRIQGCEVLSPDCTCYRWAFNSQGSARLRGAGGSEAVAYAHPKIANCATVVYTPKALDETIVSLHFQLDHIRTVVPPSWFYALYAEWQGRTKAQKEFTMPFFSYVYLRSEGLCGDEQEKPIGMSYACDKHISFGIVPVTAPNPGTHFHILGPLALGL